MKRQVPQFFFLCETKEWIKKKTQNKVNQSFQPKCSLKFTQTLNNKCTRKKDPLTKTTRLGKGFAFWLSFLRKQKITTFKDLLLSYWTTQPQNSSDLLSMFLSLFRWKEWRTSSEKAMGGTSLNLVDAWIFPGSLLLFPKFQLIFPCAEYIELKRCFFVSLNHININTTVTSTKEGVNKHQPPYTKKFRKL